jgi:dTDP-4-dehydrorhamnose 3,5-epimerase
VEATILPEILVLTPQVHLDERGFFMETWSQAQMESVVEHPGAFVQDNQSRSAFGVLRGLHYQLTPFAQAKLIRVVRGTAFDVAVDLRRSSDTFGSWCGIELTAENHRQLWIPPGFAHGFLALEDGTDLVYKTTSYYAPEYSRSVRWNDPQIGIKWPLTADPILSHRDIVAPLLREAEVFA